MDPNRFDAIARQLGAARSRRGMVKALGAAALGAIGLTGGRGAGAAPAGKVGICHRTDDPANPYVYITVSQNAAPAHEAHGDAIGVALATDPEHCGGCGNVCPTPASSTATCNDGDCGFTCLEGFADCNGDSGDGCEIHTDTDVNNCGACGNVCPGPASGSGIAICNGGKCDISCGKSGDGYQLILCNGACVDKRYPDNCGGCGNVCPDGCKCEQSRNGIFCYSGRSGDRPGCTSDADCMVAGETCQDINSSGRGTCKQMSCQGSDEAGVCPAGSQCTAGVVCDELCRAV